MIGCTLDHSQVAFSSSGPYTHSLLHLLQLLLIQTLYPLSPPPSPHLDLKTTLSSTSSSSFRPYTHSLLLLHLQTLYSLSPPPPPSLPDLILTISSSPSSSSRPYTHYNLLIKGASTSSALADFSRVDTTKVFIS